MDYACRVATFGLDEVTKILAYWGRKGYEALPDKAAFHSAGGRARAANGRDSKGRFVAVVKE